MVMKIFAGRPNDLADIARLRELYPAFDHSEVLAGVEQLAEILETPELNDTARKLLGIKK